VKSNLRFVLTSRAAPQQLIRFGREAQARDISLSGTVILGLDTELRSGDGIGILYAGKKARCRALWVRQSGTSHKVQAAVHRIAPDQCPWKELLAEDNHSQ
jgi:hypothetical protein